MRTTKITTPRLWGGKITWRDNMSELVKDGLMMFVVTVEEDYSYLVEYKVKAFSLRDAVEKLNVDLKHVKEWRIKDGLK
jgi:hypothetical protein